MHGNEPTRIVLVLGSHLQPLMPPCVYNGMCAATKANMYTTVCVQRCTQGSMGRTLSSIDGTTKETLKVVTGLEPKLPHLHHGGGSYPGCVNEDEHFIKAYPEKKVCWPLLVLVCACVCACVCVWGRGGRNACAFEADVGGPAPARPI